VRKQQTAHLCQDRTIVVDFHDESTYFALLNQGRVFIDFVVASVLALGFQLKHSPAC
jgi:hypothetical protein